MAQSEAGKIQVSKTDGVNTLFGLLMLFLLTGFWAHLWVR